MLLAEANLRDSLIDVGNLQGIAQRQQLIERRRVYVAARNQCRLDMGANWLVAVATVAAPIEFQLGCFCVSHSVLPFHVQSQMQIVDEFRLSASLISGTFFFNCIRFFRL